MADIGMRRAAPRAVRMERIPVSYFADFDCIEIQSTFYDPPALAVARKWRAAAPPGFAFCIKAWQLITHEAASPTYRRLRAPIAVNEPGFRGLIPPDGIGQRGVATDT